MLRTALAILVLLLGAALVAAAERPAVRYTAPGDSGECLARQVVHLPAETGILVLGSSRIRRGVSPEQLAKALNTDRPVYNMGRPGLSTLREYILLRDLYARGLRPEIIVMEADLDTLRGVYDLGKTETRWQWVHTTAKFMTFQDHFNLTPLVSDAGALGHFGILADGISQKIRQGVAMHASGRVVDTNVEGGVPETVCMLPSFDNPSPRERRQDEARKVSEKERIEALLGPIETNFDDRFDLHDNGPTRAELYYLDKIRTLAEKHGARLYVVRLHSYGRAPYAPEVTKQLQAMIPEVIVPPRDIILATNQDFMDKTHMGPEARMIYTAWLANALRTNP